ncbi:uncharacterized protein SPSK_01947 [Sporothrix schenckii 1099-18]|uniref:Uncharacterized protein n=1 Tax=Sporothrix schenckii 1099-18 TaxID=1397361 RepID=A0A0F2MBG2_SPOSC|nr:uncharacterized protein SPSK_01947 [Sporothrix schenckii 1099-18]KJR87033.1 hypothetical protein SPSK_01947 [Sporothrix schenckii 1099-18]
MGGRGSIVIGTVEITTVSIAIYVQLSIVYGMWYARSTSLSLDPYICVPVASMPCSGYLASIYTDGCNSFAAGMWWTSTSRLYDVVGAAISGR